MKHQRILCLGLAALTLPLLVALRQRADEPVFAPKADHELGKNFEFELELQLEDLSVKANGQELPSEMVGSGMEEPLSISATIAVTDQFVATKAGRHAELLRTFEALAFEAGSGGSSEKSEDLAGLQGTKVRFKWDEEASDYVVSVAEGSAEQSSVEGLSPDMDLLPLLPGREVEVGATWTVKGADLATVFLPGGMLPLPSSGEAEEFMGVVREELEGQFAQAFKDLELRCKYAGSREEDGQRLGEIEIQFQGKASIDLSEILKNAIAMQAGEVDVEVDLNASLDLDFKGEGSLVWNLGARHVHGFEMSSDMTALLDVEADISAMGQEQQMEAAAEFSGKASWKLGTKSAD